MRVTVAIVATFVFAYAAGWLGATNSTSRVQRTLALDAVACKTNIDTDEYELSQAFPVDGNCVLLPKGVEVDVVYFDAYWQQSLVIYPDARPFLYWVLSAQFE